VVHYNITLVFYAATIRG